MDTLMIAGDICPRNMTEGCPVHECYEAKMAAANAWRRRSVDIGCITSPINAPLALLQDPFQRTWTGASQDVAGYPWMRKNPFHHSHSVTCASVEVRPPTHAYRARSVGNLTAPLRARPNVLELCPNQNISYNAYRRRYSRSSERSLDGEDPNWETQDYFTTSSRLLSIQKSASKSLEGSLSGPSGRRGSAGQGRLATIRKGLSMLSLCTGEEDEDEEGDDHLPLEQKRILRPPTRHFYRRGISGLPVKCPAKYMGVAF